MYFGRGDNSQLLKQKAKEMDFGAVYQHLNAQLSYSVFPIPSLFSTTYNERLTPQICIKLEGNAQCLETNFISGKYLLSLH